MAELNRDGRDVSIHTQGDGTFQEPMQNIIVQNRDDSSCGYGRCQWYGRNALCGGQRVVDDLREPMPPPSVSSHIPIDHNSSYQSSMSRTYRGQAYPVSSAADFCYEYPRYVEMYDDRGGSRQRFQPSFGGVDRSPHSAPCGMYGGGSRPVPTKRLMISPEKYDGTSSLNEYLNNFEDVAKWNNWDLVEKAMQMRMNLEGSAKRAVSMLSVQQRQNYNMVVEILKRSFGDPNEEIIYQEEFWRRARNRNELTVDFANDLKRLGGKAFSGMCNEQSAAYMKMLVNRFVSGIGDPDLGKWVHMQQPCTLEEAVEIARNYESYLKVNGKNLGKHSNPDRVFSVGEVDVMPHYRDERRHGTSTCAVESSETMSLLKQLLEGQQKQSVEIAHIKADISSLKQQVQNNTKSMEIMDSRLKKVEQNLKAIQAIQENQGTAPLN